jgi:hypothetical protein
VESTVWRQHWAKLPAQAGVEPSLTETNLCVKFYWSIGLLWVSRTVGQGAQLNTYLAALRISVPSRRCLWYLGSFFLPNIPATKLTVVFWAIRPDAFHVGISQWIPNALWPCYCESAPTSFLNPITFEHVNPLSDPYSPFLRISIYMIFTKGPP